MLMGSGLLVKTSLVTGILALEATTVKRMAPFTCTAPLTVGLVTDVGRRPGTVLL